MNQTILPVLEWWHLLVIIGGLTLSIMIIVYFISRLKSLGSVSLGNVISFNKGDRGVNAKETLLHTLILLNNISTEIYSIKYRNTIASQMHKAEEFLLQIKANALNIVGYAIKDALNSKYTTTSHSDYLNFKLALQECIARMKDIVRGSCLNNGFSKLNPKEFDEYVEGIIDRISNMTRNFFQESLVLTLIDIDETLEEDEKMSELLRVMYNKILDISKEKEAETEELTRQRYDIIKQSWGLELCKDKDQS